MRFWLLLYADAPNPRGVPHAWPAEVSTDPHRAPWVEMATRQDVADYMALHQADYDAWRAANPPDRPGITPSVIVGEGGTRWKVDATGKLVPA